jgi:aspartate ammonia-lyase
MHNSIELSDAPETVELATVRSIDLNRVATRTERDLLVHYGYRGRRGEVPSVAKRALAENRRVSDVVLEERLLTSEEIARLFCADSMTSPIRRTTRVQL